MWDTDTAYSSSIPAHSGSNSWMISWQSFQISILPIWEGLSYIFLRLTEMPSMKLWWVSKFLNPLVLVCIPRKNCHLYECFDLVSLFLCCDSIAIIPSRVAKWMNITRKLAIFDTASVTCKQGINLKALATCLLDWPVIQHTHYSLPNFYYIGPLFIILSIGHSPPNYYSISMKYPRIQRLCNFPVYWKEMVFN